MSKKCKVIKDNNQRKVNARHRDKRAALKLQILGKTPTEDGTVAMPGSPEQMQLIFKLNKMKKDGSRVRLHNRCQVTGRPRGVESTFKMSRLVVREMISHGELAGWVKSAW